jgi:2-succinyl-6-hydroxy-2,4-cyclohexadiene-1-carboxylate synthase
MTPLVLLHGFLGSPGDWNLFRGRFADYDLITPQLPVAATWDESIVELNRQIPRGSFIGGYSMGARLALGCVVAAPERFRGLALISGNPGIEPSERQDRLQHDLNVARTLEDGDFVEFLRDWYRQPLFENLNDVQIQRLILQKSSSDPAYQARLLRANSVARQPNYWNALRHLHVPLLAIAGALDRKYAEIARRVGRDSACARCELISNCGHNVPFEQPERLVQLLREWTG